MATTHGQAQAMGSFFFFFFFFFFFLFLSFTFFSFLIFLNFQSKGNFVFLLVLQGYWGTFHTFNV
jgi:hypothetical protein